MNNKKSPSIELFHALLNSEEEQEGTALNALRGLTGLKAETLAADDKPMGPWDWTWPWNKDLGE